MYVFNHIVISQTALQFLDSGSRKKEPNIVIYRDNPPISCNDCNIGTSTFVISINVLYSEKPNESVFMPYDNSYGIPVWVEKGISKYLENKPILINLKKGLFKRLIIEVGSEILQSR
jgi:hypothetical protein